MSDNFKIIGNLYEDNDKLNAIKSTPANQLRSMLNQVRGEFLIEKIEDDIKHIFTDPWATKGAGKGYTPNTHYVYNPNGSLRSTEVIVKWNLEQHKDTIDDCVQEVIKSIQLRYEPNCLLLLSGGIDSSAIAVILHDLGHYVTCLSVNENTDQIQEYCNKHEYIRWDQQKRHPNLVEKIAKFAKEQIGKTVILTGNVCDGPYYNNDIHFKFPKNLKEIFPWADFNQNKTVKICNLWDRQAYNYGVDFRMCFADRVLMQEFLNLIPEIKNQRYKHHISLILEQRGLDLNKFTKLDMTDNNYTKSLGD